MDVKIMLSRTRPGLGHNEARRLIQRAITAALREENVPAGCEVSVLLTDNEGIHELNSLTRRFVKRTRRRGGCSSAIWRYRLKNARRRR